MLLPTTALLQLANPQEAQVTMSLQNLRTALDSLSVASSVLQGSMAVEPSTTSPVEASAEAALIYTTLYPALTCQGACDTISSCKDSGKGSYCKIANSPSMCFALYWKTDGSGTRSFCYAGDNDCPESQPVMCDGATEIVI